MMPIVGTMIGRSPVTDAIRQENLGSGNDHVGPVAVERILFHALLDGLVLQFVVQGAKPPISRWLSCEARAMRYSLLMFPPEPMICKFP